MNNDLLHLYYVCIFTFRPGQHWVFQPIRQPFCIIGDVSYYTPNVLKRVER